ncbi:MAG: aminodeoxychorismate/anthranilate synthase component II [Ignavibacteria bacterium]
MILVIDNYDSFTFNLVQSVQKLVHQRGEEVRVRRNDAISLDDIRRLRPSRILLSPGPGRPEHAGVTLDVIKAVGKQTPILGVCLGHQAIGVAFGARVVQAPTLMHGKTSLIFHAQTSVFRSIKNPFRATRYHSLVIAQDSVPADLEVLAMTDDGVIMGIRHVSLPIIGVQFHPESILTEQGDDLLGAWLEMQESS